MIARSLAALLFPAISAIAGSHTAAAQSSELFSQGASATLEHRFEGRGLSWLLLDDSGNLLARHWTGVSRPIAPGSLLKPFVAIAYGEQNNFLYPRLNCPGISGQCWLARGHGHLDLEKAIAQSCNAYFLALAARLERKRAMATFAHFGLNGPSPDANAEALIGLGGNWRETPTTIALAYLKLIHDSPITARSRVTAGMQTAAEIGTARDVDRALGSGAALAKTGTAQCSHHPRGAADGFAVVLYPAAQPRVLLLVRMHAATGALASAQAGAMLRALGLGEP